MKRKVCSGHALAMVAMAVAIAAAGVRMPATAAQRVATDFAITPHHIGISVANLDESIAWYGRMLGFEVVRRNARENESQTVIALLRRDDCYLELFEIPGAAPLPEYRRDPSADLRVHGIKHFAFQVDDARAAAETLRARGAEIAMGPVENERSIFVFIRDNSGNAFELIQYKTP